MLVAVVCFKFCGVCCIPLLCPNLSTMAPKKVMKTAMKTKQQKPEEPDKKEKAEKPTPATPGPSKPKASKEGKQLKLNMERMRQFLQGSPLSSLGESEQCALCIYFGYILCNTYFAYLYFII